MPDSPGSYPSDEFYRWVGDALSQLYDSAVLQNHPLGKALFPGETNPLRRGQSLRKALLDAIHTLEPGPGVPGTAPDRRIFRLVELRYIEGLDPAEAMARLSLAKSQFYRDQGRAVELLAAALWDALPSPPPPPESNDPRARLLHAELERLSPSRESEVIDAASLTSDLSQIITPLTEDRNIRLETLDLHALEGISLDRILLRQALLTALLAALDIPTLRSLSLSSLQETALRCIHVSADFTELSPAVLENLKEPLEACRLLGEALGASFIHEITTQNFLIGLCWSEESARKLLVIDDNTGMADLFRLYVKSTHWQVLAAGGGREARQVLEEFRPDLIILDILMPQEDGWDLLRMLKTDSKSREVPVIICSVLKQPQIALKLGAADYLEKPVSQQSLLDLLSKY